MMVEIWPPAAKTMALYFSPAIFESRSGQITPHSAPDTSEWTRPGRQSATNHHAGNMYSSSASCSSSPVPSASS